MVYYVSRPRTHSPLLVSLLLLAGSRLKEHRDRQHPWNKAAHFAVTKKQSGAREGGCREEEASVQSPSRT